MNTYHGSESGRVMQMTASTDRLPGDPSPQPLSLQGRGAFLPSPREGEGGPQGRVRARTDGLKRAIGIICITRSGRC